MFVSKYPSVFSKLCATDELFNVLENIKNGKYRNEVKACRDSLKNGDVSRFKALKLKLPAVTFCGTFNQQHKVENLITYNKLLVLDIDHIEESHVNDLKRNIETDQFTFSVWKSPSGTGLKILIKVDSEMEAHFFAFNAVANHYENNFNVVIDKSGSDLSRLCYVSWDDSLYINRDSSTFTFNLNELEYLENKKETNSNNYKLSVVQKKNLKKTDGLNNKHDRAIMKKIIVFLKKRKLSITETHEKWYKCAYSISNTFSYDVGQKYFLCLCELDGVKYDEYKSAKIIEYCYLHKRHNGLSFSTIIHYAKEKGFELNTPKK